MTLVKEIERKFLVRSLSYREFSVRKKQLVQGYLNSDPSRTVRIRIDGERGVLTIKGKSNASGMSRFEWETEMSLSDAQALLQLCEPGVIEKTRYHIPHGSFVFEVDEFSGDNQGLILAEIELTSEGDEFSRPEWLGAEVTQDERFYNSYLSKKPFKAWEEAPQFLAE